MEKEPTNYWIARLREGNIPIGLSWQFAKGMEEGVGIGEGIYSSYYRYNKNKRNAEVTKYLKAVKQVKPGDILLIVCKNKIHAYSVVEEHKFEYNQVWSIERTLKREEHDFKKGKVCFCDSKVFFEDYSDEDQNWRQCIKVRGFCDGDNDSLVTTYGVKAACLPGGNPQNTLFKVTPEFAIQKKSELIKQYEAKNKNK